MPAYFSEIDYFGTDADEFIEVAVPAGTDTSGYTVQLYDTSGTQIYTFSLGAVQTSIGGYDVYVIDNTNPAFDSGGDATGVLYPDDALALVDGGGTVQQFVSWGGNTVTPGAGDAAGLTSTSIGSAMAADQSLQSDDRGASYYTQTSTNKGTIPACYARGTWIDTPDGARRIETLRCGDDVSTARGGTAQIRWIWRKEQVFETNDPRAPIRLKAGCLGAGPNRDLVVSTQHRIAVGMPDQLPGLPRCLVPAKALASLRGVHVMKNRKSLQWFHIMCDTHALIRANGTVSETLYLGPQLYLTLTRQEREDMCRHLGRDHVTFGQDAPVLPCLTAGKARDLLDHPGKDRKPLQHAPRLHRLAARRNAKG